ncbi:MAG: hypothetical protein ABSA17_02825 [Rhabdochlamydiaceae bacterium]
MGSKTFFFLCLCVISLHASETCFFIPPKNWEIANPEILAPRVHICFLGKSSKGLAPSINLASEKVDISLDAYIEEVRKIHAADPNSRWRDLGKYKTLLGEGRLTELETHAETGIVRMVQLIVIKDHVAYILTAGALKEEFPKYYKLFDQTLRSLQSSKDLIESYSSKESRQKLSKLVQNVEQQFKAAKFTQPDIASVFKKELNQHPPASFLSRAIKTLDKQFKTAVKDDDAFNSKDFQESAWQPFEKKVINDFTEMGPYWQILLLQDIQVKLLNLRSQ